MSSPSTSEVRRFELLAYELSTRFISLASSRIDAAIEAGLQRIVETLGVDRSTLSHAVHETGHFHSTHTFAAAGIPAIPSSNNSRMFPWTLSRARAGLPVVFSRLSELPAEAQEVKTDCELHDIALELDLDDQLPIANTGGGIAEGDLERVFESFYSTKANGLGVGLAICRKLIEAHGGALWASHATGGGAVFRFTLPPGPPAIGAYARP